MKGMISTAEQMGIRKADICREAITTFQTLRKINDGQPVEPWVIEKVTKAIEKLWARRQEAARNLSVA